MSNTKSWMHELTLEELKDRIVSQWDATDLLEHLDIGIEDLVEAFTDKIEDRYESIIQAIEE